MGLGRDLVAGALAGAAGTVPMSAVMWAAQRAGLMGRQPPAKIVDAAAEAVDAQPAEEPRNVAATVAHVGFGAACGAAFAPVWRRLPAWIQPTATVAFALGVWAASYQGWVPALGIMPPASRDRPGRPEAMAAAHVVFGVTLSGVLAAFDRRAGR